MQQAQVRSTILHRGIARALYAGVLATALSLTAVPAAWAQSPAPIPFDIPAQPLPAALKAFADQAGMQLLYRAEVVGNATARPVQGRLDKRQALQQLLEGTGLEVVYSGEDAATIRPRPTAPAGAEKTPLRRTDAAASPERINATPVAARATPSARGSAQQRTLDALTVTGTRIRGGTTPSPVISIGAQQIQEEGFTDLGEVIRSVPQNFGGGQNPEVPGGNTLQAGLANQNITGGSSLNLRGLGPDATLTLLNGRRLSYGGFVQAVDISAIPVEAVERIEIVADGASAIYGSDAVGGVGNVILKRDYEGVTVGARYGGATDGGLTTREYNVTAGTHWSSGGLIAAYRNVSVDPIYAGDRDYTDYLSDPRTIYPGSDLRSGLLSAYQRLGDNVELRLDALRSKREQESSFFTSSLPRYSYLTPETTSTVVSPSIEFLLPKDWTLTIGGAWGEDEHVSNQSRIVIATGVSTLQSNDCYCNESFTYEAGAEGPLFALPAGDARLAVGAGYRKSEFRQINYITDITTTQGEESARFAYAEINLPLIGAESNIAGVQRLSMTAAVRGEDYDSFGSVTTPKFGLIYGPSADFSLKAAWGKSFKAPTLYQRNYAQFVQLNPPSYFGGAGYAADTTALLQGGGNPNLDPERARTWTASLTFHPEVLPSLEAELTWFNIDYTDRVVQPIVDFSQALSNSINAPFVNYSPTAEDLEEVIAGAQRFTNYTGAPYDPGNVVAIIHYGYTNVARQEIEGLDLSGSYRFDLGPGRMTMRGSVTWMDSSQQTSPAQEAFDLAGTLFNPSKVSGRIGAVWNQGGFSASGFANYKSGVTNTVNDEKTASFTTFDATLRYATGYRDGVLSGLEFALSAQNLFNREPPLHTPASIIYSVPYDPTNYSAIGRFLSLSVSKRF